MAEEEASRTLRDYVTIKESMPFSSMVIPTTTKTLKIDLYFLILIRVHQFTTMEHEDLYSHLNTFYELVANLLWVTSNRAWAVVSWHLKRIWVTDVGWLISLLVFYGWCAYWMM